MQMWHRLHVFAQIVNVLCVIGDVVLIVDHPQWPTANFSTFKISQHGIFENVHPSTIVTDKSTDVDMLQTDFDGTSIAKHNEATRSIEQLVDNSIADSRMKETMEKSIRFGGKSSDGYVSDLDNVIDTLGDSKIQTKEPSIISTTETPEPPQCTLVENQPTLRSLDYSQNVPTTTDTPIENAVIAKNLSIIERTTKTLTISWTERNDKPIQYYEIKWYKLTTLIGGCKMSNSGANNAVVIESLNACTTYRVTVFESPNDTVATVNGTTELAVNDESVKLGAVTGSKWIAISWTLPCTDCVLLYKIKVCKIVINMLENECVEATTNLTTHNQTRLDSGFSYMFDLTIQGQEKVYGSINVTVKTTIPEPEIKECEMTESPWPLNNLEIRSVTSTKNLEIPSSPKADDEIIVEDLEVNQTLPSALLVSWKRPNGTHQVSHYIIEWYPDHATNISACKASNTTFIYAIKMLASCTTYTVSVTPHLSTATGSKRVVSGTTSLNVGEDKLNLKIADSGHDWLKLSWNMPSTDCVSHYAVIFYDADKFTETKLNNTTYTQKDLSPCRSYTFNLTVYGPENFGSLNITGTTAFLEPEKPSPATTLAGNYSLLVSWPKPVGHTCVKHYRVVWSRPGQTRSNNTRMNSLMLDQLDSCVSYEIIITAVSILDKDSLQEIIRSNKTAPAVIGPPMMDQETSVSEKEISINWRIRTDETNNCVPAKLIVECLWTKTLGFGYTSVNRIRTYIIPNNTMNAIIDTIVNNVSPFTKYDCHSYVFNYGGRSRNSSIIKVETLEDIPTAPKLLPESSSDVTNASITLRWKKPISVPGILEKMMILVIWQYDWKHRPPGCIDSSGTKNITIGNGSVTSYVYTAVPYSIHRIKIVAATGAGWGSSSEVQIYHTKPGAPAKVANLDCRIYNSFDDFNTLITNVTWTVPCLFHSKNIEYFNVSWNGHRSGFEDHHFFQIVNYTNENCDNDSCSLVVDGLREEHVYSIQVAAKGVDYNDLGDVSDIVVVYPAGIPPEPNKNYTSIITIDPYKARRTTTTATILLPLFPDIAGEIKCYAITVSKIGYNNATFGRLGKNERPAIATWKESYDKDFELPYEAAKFCLDSLHSYIVDYGPFEAVKFVLGEDTETCPEISSNKGERSYCNGPLNPNTLYHVRMRAFTTGGYSDSTVFIVKTHDQLHLDVVIRTVLGILFLGIFLTMILLVRKCSLRVVVRRFLHSDMPGSPVPAPFTRRKFIAHCQQLADNPGKLSNEYQLLQTLSVDLQMPTNAACLQANRKKNRYTDILPYDFSRVKLEVIDNDPNTDYINASFIKGFTGEEDYIACQGPKEETTYDFWRMIDQYDVKLIVMLTQLVEKNKEKCHQYFPTIRETFTYENMAIRCSMELDYRTYTQRTLVLHKDNAKRNIIHLHFKDWPDHDVPEDFDPIINFCQIMRRHMEPNRGQVVIHCSAGIGRTGTLIAIDILLQHIKDNRKLDVFGTVYRLRHNRINMVQRESQYAYIYNCIRQVLKNPYFSKTYKPPSVDPVSDNNLFGKKKETSTSNTDLVSSLETCTRMKASDYLITTSSEKKHLFIIIGIHKTELSNTYEIIAKISDVLFIQRSQMRQIDRCDRHEIVSTNHRSIQHARSSVIRYSHERTDKQHRKQSRKNRFRRILDFCIRKYPTARPFKIRPGSIRRRRSFFRYSKSAQHGHGVMKL